MARQSSVVIADSDQPRRMAVAEELSGEVSVSECATREALLDALRQSEPAAIVLGTLPGGPPETIEAANQVREAQPGSKVILVADFSSEAVAIGALRAGVSEYLKGPVTVREVVEAVTKVLPLTQAGFDDCPELVGPSAGMREVKEVVRRIAPMDCTVLITGETGTGKEVVARLIHRLSRRREKPLVCVNCSALPDTLVEGELFGHERGAFTGAVSRQMGRMKAADAGTLFLDEVGDLSPSAQAKILRATEEGEVQPLGCSKPITLDLRLIAATHQSLEVLVDRGQFRMDLFYRLHVARIFLPPLRDRADDIPLLANHFLRQFNRAHGRRIEGFTPKAMQLLTRQDWPGNVRQLRNAVEAAVVMSPSDRITEQDLHALQFCRSSAPMPLNMTAAVVPGLRAKLGPESLRQALEATNWSVVHAAELLRWSRATVYRKMAEYGLKRLRERLVNMENARDGERGSLLARAGG